MTPTPHDSRSLVAALLGEGRSLLAVISFFVVVADCGRQLAGIATVVTNKGQGPMQDVNAS